MFYVFTFYVFTMCSQVFSFVIRCHFLKSKSLASIVRSRYGSHTLKIIREYEKLGYRYQKLDLDIQFLETYIREELCPTFLRYKMSNKRLQTSDADRRSQSLFLQEKITLRKKSVENEKTRKMLSKLEVDLRSAMSFVDWIHVSNNFISCNIKTIRKVEDVQRYKLAELMGSKLHHNPNEVIHNFSSYQLSEIEKLLLLCKGLNFALPQKKFYPLSCFLETFTMKIKEINPFCILKVRSKMLDCHPSDCIIKRRRPSLRKPF